MDSNVRDSPDPLRDIGLCLLWLTPIHNTSRLQLRYCVVQSLISSKYHHPPPYRPLILQHIIRPPMHIHSLHTQSLRAPQIIGMRRHHNVFFRIELD
jgi:hypothetical protein